MHLTSRKKYIVYNNYWSRNCCSPSVGFAGSCWHRPLASVPIWDYVLSVFSNLSIQRATVSGVSGSNPGDQPPTPRVWPLSESAHLIILTRKALIQPHQKKLIVAANRLRGNSWHNPLDLWHLTLLCLGAWTHRCETEPATDEKTQRLTCMPIVVGCQDSHEMSFKLVILAAKHPVEMFFLQL